MKSPDTVVSWIVLGPILPVSFTLAGWWGAVLLREGIPVIIGAFAGGLLLGVTLTLTVFRRWVGSLFALSSRALGFVALFYSILIYGAFMGLPLFNSAVGFVGGLVFGHRADVRGYPPERVRWMAHRWAIGATLLLLVFCLASAGLALNEASAGSEIQHMFRLPFEVTHDRLVLLLVGGGLGLLAFQYVVARFGVWLGSQRLGQPPLRAE